MTMVFSDGRALQVVRGVGARDCWVGLVFGSGIGGVCAHRGGCKAYHGGRGTNIGAYPLFCLPFLPLKKRVPGTFSSRVILAITSPGIAA